MRCPGKACLLMPRYHSLDISSGKWCPGKPCLSMTLGLSLNNSVGKRCLGKACLLMLQSRGLNISLRKRYPHKPCKWWKRCPVTTLSLRKWCRRRHSFSRVDLFYVGLLYTCWFRRGIHYMWSETDAKPNAKCMRRRQRSEWKGECELNLKS